MSSITLTQISNGQTADATVVDNNFDTIANLVNGNIDSDNIKASAVDTDNVADDAITLDKIAPEEWTDWVPSYSASGSMTYTGVTTTVARYIKIGNTVHYRIDATGTTGGTASSALDFTLPLTAKDALGVAGYGLARDPSTVGAFAYFASTTQAEIQKVDISNFGLGANRTIRISGTYEVA